MSEQQREGSHTGSVPPAQHDKPGPKEGSHNSEPPAKKPVEVPNTKKD